MDSLSTLYSGPFWALCARPDIFPEFSSASASPRTGGPEEWVWSVVRDMDMVGVLLYYRCHHRGHWVLVWWLEPLAPLSCLGFNLIFHLGTTALHSAHRHWKVPTSHLCYWLLGDLCTIKRASSATFSAGHVRVFASLRKLSYRYIASSIPDSHCADHGPGHGGVGGLGSGPGRCCHQCCHQPCH